MASALKLALHECGHKVLCNMLETLSLTQTRFIDKLFMSLTCLEKLVYNSWALEVFRTLLKVRSKSLPGQFALDFMRFLPHLMVNEVGHGYLFALIGNCSPSFVHKIIKSMQNYIPELISSPSGVKVLLSVFEGCSISRQRDLTVYILEAMEKLCHLNTNTSEEPDKKGSKEAVKCNSILTLRHHHDQISCHCVHSCLTCL